VSTTLPVEWYTDEGALRTERETIFRRRWQFAGFTEQVEQPGQFATTTIAAVPVVLVRGKDEVLRAFVNVCRHRMHVVAEGCGVKSSLQCPYHAWTYGLDGELRAAPRSEADPEFDKSTLGLVPLLVDTWGPFVFVNLDTGATETLRDWLGPIPERVAGMGCDVDRLVRVKSIDFELRANWKIVAENYLECYHCAPSHPVLNKVFDTAQFPFRMADDWFVADMARREQPDPAAAGAYASTVGPPFTSVDYVFPNFAPMFWPGDGSPFVVYEWQAATPELSTGTIHYCFDTDASEEDRQAFMQFADPIWDEDVDLVESVHRGVAAGMVREGYLLPDEGQIRHFQQRVLDAMEVHA
jgi:choline monooxygenase